MNSSQLRLEVSLEVVSFSSLQLWPNVSKIDLVHFSRQEFDARESLKFQELRVFSQTPSIASNEQLEVIRESSTTDVDCVKLPETPQNSLKGNS
jgi:hypothetical protein